MNLRLRRHVQPDNRIPTPEEFRDLFHDAREALATLDALHAAHEAEYQRARTALIARNGSLIAGYERYYGGDLRQL